MSDHILSVILQNMLAQARNHPGELIRQILPHGLWIQLKLDGGLIHLYLSRQTTFPSKQEFETVLKYWPWKVQAEPAEQEYNQRLYLYASWVPQ